MEDVGWEEGGVGEGEGGVTGSCRGGFSTYVVLRVSGHWS